MHQQVIDKRALFIHQARIVGLPDDQFRGVIAGDVLDQRQRLRPADFNFAHVADVKQPGSRARGHMLGHDARILHGHVPAAKIDHFGFEAAVYAVQRGLAKWCGGRRCHSKFSESAARNRN